MPAAVVPAFVATVATTVGLAVTGLRPHTAAVAGLRVQGVGLSLQGLGPDRERLCQERVSEIVSARELCDKSLWARA